MSGDFLSGMQGLTLEGMKGLVRCGRLLGKVQLCRYRGKWVLLFMPPGAKSKDGWASRTFYLMAEKSRQPRLFATADAALNVANGMSIPGVWVDFYVRGGACVLP